MQSRPFDIGITCSTAINLLAQNLGKKKENLSTEEIHKLLESAFKSIRHANHNSLSNGYLMRNTPMAIMTALIKEHKHSDIAAITQLIRGTVTIIQVKST